MTIDPEKAAINRALFAKDDAEARRELDHAAAFKAQADRAASAVFGDPDLFHQPADDTPETPGWLANPPHELVARFAEFHRENPHVYVEIERRALTLYRVGVKRFGMKAITEAMRFDHAIETKGDAWKLNNSHTAYYARLLLHRHPELAALIETREATAAAVARSPAP